MAKRKLKIAEEFSDLNSGTEKEESLKKSRKIRAAKQLDTSTSSDEEESDKSFTSYNSDLFYKKTRHDFVYSKKIKNYKMYTER